MSQSLLYHAFGVRDGYDYRATKYVEGRVEFHLKVEKKLTVCPECKGLAIHRRGGRTRRIRSMPIGMKETVLVVEVPQCHCAACEKTFEVLRPSRYRPSIWGGGTGWQLSQTKTKESMPRNSRRRGVCETGCKCA